MAGNHVTFVPNMEAIELVRRLPRLEVELTKRAKKLAKACNEDFVLTHEAHDPEWAEGDSPEGYRVGTFQGKTRFRATVITATQHAINDNRRSHTIVRNVEVLFE